jgi:DNA polymerase delta subunit 1
VIVADAEREHWKRKPAPLVDPAKDAIVFQQLDIDYVIGEPHPMLGERR